MNFTGSGFSFPNSEPGATDGAPEGKTTLSRGMLLYIISFSLTQLVISQPFFHSYHNRSHARVDDLSPENIGYLHAVGIRDRCKGKWKELEVHLVVCEWKESDVHMVISGREFEEITPPGWIQHTGLPWTAVLFKPPPNINRSHHHHHHFQKMTNDFMKEGSGYLEYILAHWDCLPKVTAFMHAHQEAYTHYTYADPFRDFGNQINLASPTHFHDDMKDILDRLCWEKVEAYLPLLNCSNKLTPEHPHFRKTMDLLAKFAPYNLHYSMSKYGLIYFCCGSFVAHRSAILKKGKRWWVDFYKYAKELDSAYIMEYSWMTLLGDPIMLARAERNYEAEILKRYCNITAGIWMRGLSCPLYRLSTRNY
eukprot:g10666.t1